MKQSWEIKKLGDISDIKTGKSNAEDADEFGIYTFFDRSKKIKKSNRFLFDCEALIVPGEGSQFFPRYFSGKFDLHQRVYSISNFHNNVNIRYVEYYLIFNYKHFENVAVGATVKSLRLRHFTEIEIPLPPLPEQKRIVSILDEAFAAIAKAKANAEQNLQNAKELFESYLQGVFEKKGDGWEERKLGESDLVEIIDGDRGKNYPTQKDFLEDGFCLFMNTKNVRPDGFEFETTMFISEAKDKAMGKGKLKRNDVVMTTRGTIGNLGVYDDSVEFENIRINSGMLIFRPNTKVITPHYLFETFRSGIFKAQIKKYTTGAAQPQLPIKTLVNFTIPVPKSIEAQQTIVRQLDALRAETQKLEAVYQKKIADLEELKKSILQKAFAGELETENELVL